MHVKIGDFGLACAQGVPDQDNFILYKCCNNFDETKFDDISLEHTKGVGTSMYSSPEQLSLNNYDTKVNFFVYHVAKFLIFL
jgi:serine/threonine protein kinase